MKLAVDRSPASVGALIAVAILVTLPMEPISVFSIGAGSFALSWTMVLVALGLVDALVTRLYSPVRSPLRVPLAAASVALVVMLPPAVFSPVGASGWLAYINFFVGICAGLLIATAWERQSLETINIVDLGFVVFVAATAVQLLSGFADAASLASFHQNSTTSWGNSNYVAGVLGVTGILLLLRRTRMRRWRMLLTVTALVALGVACLTLSRGGVVTIAVGLGAMFWVLPRTAIAKFFCRALAIFSIIGVYWIINVIEDQRATVNSQVYKNVDTRFAIWQDAIDSIIHNPILGSGWAGFRLITADAVEQHTFAHNVVLSYLQIGGLLMGGAVLAALVFVAVRGIRLWPAILPAILAALSISLTDPFTEGTVGAMTTWLVLSFPFVVSRPHTAFSGATHERSVMPVYALR